MSTCFFEAAAMKEKILFICLFPLAALLLSGCVAEMVYHPASGVEQSPADIGLSYEKLRFRTSDGVALSGWWVPAAGAEKTVLFFHGNAGNIGGRLDTIRIIRSMGLNLFIFDYRGFGESEGSPSKNGLYRDADAAFGFLTEQMGISPGSVVLWGRSLGGAVAAQCAARHPAGMLILESTFTSMKDAADDLFFRVPGFVLRNHAYETLRYLEKADIPTLVIHSPDDEVIDFSHGRRLYEAAPGQKSFIELQGSHNYGFLRSEDVYVAGILQFIANVR